MERSPQIHAENQTAQIYVLTFKGMADELRLKHVKWPFGSAFSHPARVFGVLVADSLSNSVHEIEEKEDTNFEVRK
jgi:hypothetical protein